MNNFDEILEDVKNSNQFNKDEWSEKKKQEKEFAYSTIEKMVKDVSGNSTIFQKYLDVQSRFDKYSVGNSLLITAQKSDATQLKDFKAWKENGVFVNKDSGIVILEPGSKFMKNDGKTTMTFNAKKVYDISDTNSRNREKQTKYDNRILLKSFLHECPVKIKTVEKLEDDTLGARYNSTENVMYISKGLESPFMFQTISQELAKIELNNHNTELNSFKSYCVSYLLCKKYGIDVSNYDFNSLPDSLKDMKVSEIKKELESIKSSFEKVNSRVTNYLETLSKSNKNKDYER